MSAIQDAATKVAAPSVDLSLLDPVLQRCPRDPSRLISLLREAQDIYGYLPFPVMDAIARHLHLSRAKVLGVATFYGQFSLVPRGRHTICICRGTACHVKGSEQILNALCQELQVQPGQTTADLNFTLETVACVGACALAPVMMVDGEYYGKLDPRKAIGALARYRQENPQ